VQLDLPVRIRWHGPLGMRLEVTQTIDVAREGLLVRRKEDCAAATRVWVTYPYDRTATPMSQAETPARILRVEKSQTGDYRVALHFHAMRKGMMEHFSWERRASSRVYSSVPIFVRPMESRWPEECMTQDLSRSGVRFETSQIYSVGDLLLAKIPWAEWARAGEIPGRVARVQPAADISIPAPAADPQASRAAMYASVAVQWTLPAARPQGT
jgi:hypothetical protein